MSRTPSFIQFTPKRAMASFENLVALANYEERLREARRIVWRDRGEKPVECEDYWECLEHASRGSIRMFIPSSLFSFGNSPLISQEREV